MINFKIFIEKVETSLLNMLLLGAKINELQTDNANLTQQLESANQLLSSAQSQTSTTVC